MQNISKKWKTKRSCIELFTVSGMYVHTFQVVLFTKV